MAKNKESTPIDSLSGEKGLNIRLSAATFVVTIKSMTPVLKWFCIISFLFCAQVKAANLPFPDIKVSKANTEKADKDIVFRRALAKEIVLEFCEKYNADFKIKFNTNAAPIQKQQIDALVKYVGDLPDESIRRNMGELVLILKGQSDTIAKDFIKNLNRIVDSDYREKNSTIYKTTTAPRLGQIALNNDEAVSDLKSKLRDLELRQAESIDEINKLRNDLKETVGALKSVATEAKEINQQVVTKNEPALAANPVSTKDDIKPYLIGILFLMGGLLLGRFFRK